MRMRMRAYRLVDFGSFEHLKVGEEEQPIAGRGEVLIKVHATSLNYRDIAMARGQYPLEHRAGLIPLSDGAGEVVAVGAEVSALAVGDRVVNSFHPRWFGGDPPPDAGQDQYGSSRDGWLTEYKVASQEAVVAFPDHLSYEEAATLPCAAATAWSALTYGTPIGPGKTVLTLGTGGVSLFAIQLAKLAGADVIATTSSAEKAQRLTGLGVDHVIDYSEVSAWGERALELTGGRGVHRVVEIGGSGTLGQSMRACGVGGEIALIGFLASSEPTLDFFEVFSSGATFRVLSVGDRSGLTNLLAAVGQAELRPVINGVFPFDDVTAAYHRLASGEGMGKVVVSVSQPHSDQESLTKGETHV